MEFFHRSVLPEETMRMLLLESGDTVLDGTAGGGGHAEKILEETGPDGRLLAFDLDPAAIEATKQKLARYGDRLVIVRENFRDMDRVAKEQGFKYFNAVLLDLGVSSYELDTPERGFSFMKDGPLDMRLDVSQELTAAAIVNSWGVEKLTEAFRLYGEERFARWIAQAIVAARHSEHIIGTAHLASIIKAAVPASARHGRIHPATRVFQALRLVVNDELGALSEALAKAAVLLAPGGRLVVISFHSLEDRIVKRAMKALVGSGGFEALTKKPLIPSSEEVESNPRARSAKLRAIKKF